MIQPGSGNQAADLEGLRILRMDGPGQVNFDTYFCSLQRVLAKHKYCFLSTSLVHNEAFKFKKCLVCDENVYFLKRSSFMGCCFCSILLLPLLLFILIGCFLIINFESISGSRSRSFVWFNTPQCAQMWTRGNLFRNI